MNPRWNPCQWMVVLLAALWGAGGPAQGGNESSRAALAEGRLAWRASEPLVDPRVGGVREDPEAVVSLKDPSVVWHEGRWHLFMTSRKRSGKVGMAWTSFKEWAEAGRSPRAELELHNQYHCAPQVLFFTPHQKWYLVYQLADTNRVPSFGPCFSTSTNLMEPRGWTKPVPMITQVVGEPRWLDFWVICDDAKAHLFYTSLDGRMWRRETAKSRFPFGWSEPVLALEGDIFEASHTYRVRGGGYLTIIEAQGGGRRYYKAYLAEKLEGPWRGVADTAARPFASSANVRQSPVWTANISHGELLRAGVDERMEVDPARMRFVFQGASDEEYRNSGNYGGIPWKMGLLEAEEAQGDAE